jgi:hypothetical protein
MGRQVQVRIYFSEQEASLMQRMVGIVVLAALAATAQQKERLLDAASMMEMETVAAPAISPDGREIVFTRTWTDKMKDQDRSNLWIVDASRRSGRPARTVSACRAGL